MVAGVVVLSVVVGVGGVGASVARGAEIKQKVESGAGVVVVGGGTSGAAAPMVGAAPSEKEERVVPTDLRPRPLGGVATKSRSEKKDGAGSSVAAVGSKSAAATLWDNPTIRTAGSLLIVMLLIFGLAVLAKKVAGKNGSLMAAIGAGGKAPAGLLEVLGRYPLSRGQVLILLKVDRRVLLLSQTTSRMRGGVGTLTTLCEMTDAEDVASILMKAEEHEGGGSNARFGALLKQFDRTHAKSGEEDDGIEVDLRSVRETDAGDRAELWDERAAGNAPMVRVTPMSDQLERAAVVHKFPVPAAPTFASHARAAEAYTSVGGMGATGTESFGSIRERLHALRGEAHR